LLDNQRNEKEIIRQGFQEQLREREELIESLRTEIEQLKGDEEFSSFGSEFDEKLGEDEELSTLFSGFSEVSNKVKKLNNPFSSLGQDDESEEDMEKTPKASLCNLVSFSD